MCVQNILSHFLYHCSSKRKCHALNSIFISPPPIFILQLYNFVYTFQVLILTVIWSPISSNMVQKNVMVFSSILSSKKGVLCHVTEGWLHMVVIYLSPGYFIAILQLYPRIFHCDFSIVGGLSDAPQIPAGFWSFLWIPEEVILAETSAKITIPGVTNSSRIYSFRNWHQNIPWNAQESGLWNIY